ncbi:MAG: trypsin-like peptidase domain-containing protein [Planctomycetota bacterium]|nr:trypsin-like peptidase domain-containing protein [Planctomycetota bacterium]
MQTDKQPASAHRLFAFAALVFLGTVVVALGTLRAIGYGREEPAPEPPTEEQAVDLYEPREVAPLAGLTAGELRTIQLFRKVAPSVVHVDAVGSGVMLDRRADDVIPSGIGSGFVWTKRGHVVTNLHVVDQRGSETSVTLADGSRWSAELIGQDVRHDLAVLMIAAPPDRLHPIELGTSTGLLIGQDVFAIGNPFGLDHTLTSGVIGGLDRRIRAHLGQVLDGVIQTDMSINPGNSGGPLLNSAGHLIGINTANSGESAAGSRVGFAVPVDVINQIVPRILKEQLEDWPELGMALMGDGQSMQFITPSGWLEKTGLEFGVLIVEVREGGAAAAAGLDDFSVEGTTVRLGDVIVGVDGISLTSRQDLSTYLSQREPGDVIHLDLRRKGEPFEVDLEFRGR